MPIREEAVSTSQKNAANGVPELDASRNVLQKGQKFAPSWRNQPINIVDLGEFSPIYEAGASVLDVDSDVLVFKLWGDVGAELRYYESLDGINYTPYGATGACTLTGVTNFYGRSCVINHPTTPNLKYCFYKDTAGKSFWRMQSVNGGLTWTDPIQVLSTVSGAGYSATDWDAGLSYENKSVYVDASTGTWYMIYDANIAGFNGNGAFFEALATSADGTTWTKFGTKGTATSGGASSITDSGKAWTPDAFIGMIIYIRAGTGAGQARRVADNDATSITVTTAWTTQPDATSQYLIGPVIANGTNATSPCLTKSGDTFYCWVAGGMWGYTPADLYLWSSPDCKVWTKLDTCLPRVHAGLNTTALLGGTLADPRIVEAGGKCYLYYTAQNSQGADAEFPHGETGLDYISLVAVCPVTMADLYAAMTSFEIPVSAPWLAPKWNLELYPTYVASAPWYEPDPETGEPMLTAEYEMRGVVTMAAQPFLHTWGATNWAIQGNLFIGKGAGNLLSTLTGGDNCGIGGSALHALTTGNRNSAVGGGSGGRITTGSDNTLLGYLAGYGLTTGGNCTAVGSQALLVSQASAASTAIGNKALYSCTTGNYNTALGYNSLTLVTEGSSNIAIGVNAGGVLTTGGGNIYIGNNSAAAAAAEANAIAIGIGTSEGSNKTVIGNANTTNTKLYGALTPVKGIIFPAADPHVAGAWWDNAGTLTKSTG